MKNELYTCPCCGYKTLEELPPGTFEICPICHWEDDNVQFNDPHFEGGANETSLYKAQRNFLEFGVSEKIYIKPGRIDLTSEYEKDVNFQIIK